MQARPRMLIVTIRTMSSTAKITPHGTINITNLTHMIIVILTTITITVIRLVLGSRFSTMAGFTMALRLGPACSMAAFTAAVSMVAAVSTAGAAATIRHEDRAPIGSGTA